MRELTHEEIHEVSGGLNWAAISTGVALVGLAAVTIGTAGIATVPAALAFSAAATGGEIFLAGTALATAGAGGFAIGNGLCY